VVGGHWILLEYVDSAAADVASILASFMGTGTLCLATGFESGQFLAFSLMLHNGKLGSVLLVYYSLINCFLNKNIKE